MAKKAQRDRGGPGPGPATQALASQHAGCPDMVTSKQREGTGNPMESKPSARKQTKRANPPPIDAAARGPPKAARAAGPEPGAASPSKEDGVNRDKPCDEIDDLFGKLKSSTQVTAPAAGHGPARARDRPPAPSWAGQVLPWPQEFSRSPRRS